MKLRCVPLLCAAAGLAILALPGCGKKGAPSGGGGGASARAADAGTPSPRPRERVAPPDRERPRRAANATSDGPTGLPDCDRTLEVVCRCAAKQPSLQQPCKTLRTDAPAWKIRAQSQTASQLDDLRQSCKRILGSVEAAYGCK